MSERLPMRFIPKDIDGLRRILDDERLSDDMKVEADEDTGLKVKTVGELRAWSTWPKGLAVITPLREAHPEAVVKIKVANYAPLPDRAKSDALPSPPPWSISII